MSSLHSHGDHVSYEGLFEKRWRQFAARRRVVRRDEQGLPFSPSLVPLLAHPDVAKLTPKAHFVILGKKLHAYNGFTTALELGGRRPAERQFPAPFCLGQERGRINAASPSLYAKPQRPGPTWAIGGG